MLLLLVMIIVVMISLAGFSFVAIMRNEDKATRLRGEEIQAEQLVRSGEEMLKVLLRQPGPVLETAGGIYNNPELFRGVLVFQDEAGQPSGRFSVLAPRIGDGAPAGFRFGVENESAKLNLAAVLSWDKQRPGAGRQALMQLPEMTEAAADAILDWLDGDSRSREFGAETEFYQSLDQPYPPRNAIVECLEELQLVRGVSSELLFGLDNNRNHWLEPQEMDAVKTAEPWSQIDAPEAFIPWASLLTIYSAERNVSATGQPRIDLNDENLAKLHQHLTDALNEPLANFIVAYRQYGPYGGSAAADLSPPGMVDLTRPAAYRFESPLDLVNVRVRLPESGQDRAQIIASPVHGDSASLWETLPDLLDRTTVFPHPILRGRINVNLAPPRVLLAVPGMDDAAVGQIIAARGSQPAGRYMSGNRQHPVWLLLEGLVDLPRMKKLLPYLTCGGEVFRAQIVGFYDREGPAARAEVVLDATRLPVRQVYWKDLRILGPGYSGETLGSDLDPRARPAMQDLRLPRGGRGA